MGQSATEAAAQPTAESSEMAETNEIALWQARQIATLVETQQSEDFESPLRDGVIASIEQLIEVLCDGQYAQLAKKVGIAKATLHSWLHDLRTPQVDISLRIARFAQIELVDLLMANLDDWSAPTVSVQLALPLDYPARPQWNRRVQIHDWVAIEEKLRAILQQPMPVSLMHAASVVQMPPRMLYMNCNTTSRKIAHRWLVYLRRRQDSYVVAAWPYLESACRQLLDIGISPNMREIERLLPQEILNRVCNCWDVLREVRMHIESSEYATAGLCDNHYPQRLMQE